MAELNSDDLFKYYLEYKINCINLIKNPTVLMTDHCKKINVDNNINSKLTRDIIKAYLLNNNTYLTDISQNKTALDDIKHTVNEIFNLQKKERLEQLELNKAHDKFKSAESQFKSAEKDYALIKEKYHYLNISQIKTGGASKQHILGRDRTVIIKGRSKFITYKGKLMNVTDARKLEKSLKSKK